MHEHYYSQQPTSQSEPYTFRDTLREVPLVFHTDRGVFSRKEIDAGTRLLVESLPRQLAGSMLDLGCGYGVVGIAMAASSPDLAIWMVDINERAVELAKQNARENRVQTRVQALQSDGCRELPESLSFDLIALNPPIRAGKTAVFGLYDEARDRLRDGGILYVVIQKKQGAPSSEAHLRELGFVVDVVAKNKGYRVYACQK